MSWAEFVLRSIGFKRVRNHEISLVRIQAHETHKVQYLFSNKKPPSIDAYWPLEGKKKATLTDEQRQAFKNAVEKSKKDG